MSVLEIFQTTLAGFSQAAWQTVLLTFWSLLVGTAIGLLFAFFSIANSKLLNGLAHLYVAVIRGTPLIVQIFAIYFGLAEFVVLDSFTAGVIALAIHAGAYIAEIFRGSIQALDRGQLEAARSLGMSYPLAMRRIILPQAFRHSIPSLGNQFIIGLKDSSLVAYIGGTELWSAGLGAAADNFRQFETYFINGLYYLALVLLFTGMIRWLERRLHVEERSAEA
jgi:polar amino acid transport system permease protein